MEGGLLVFQNYLVCVAHAGLEFTDVLTCPHAHGGLPASASKFMHANSRLIRCESYLWMPAKLLAAFCRHLPSLRVGRATPAHRWEWWSL